MNKSIIITSQENNHYLYSDVCRYFIYVPQQAEDFFDGGRRSLASNDYYSRKYLFLKKYHLLDKEEISLVAKYPVELIRRNLACLRQLLIEVTDSCNLQCKYCGYGEFYGNYDERETKKQTFENAKILIDYLAKLWQSEYNISQDNTVMIGFYGGEPLVNMKLIKEVIAYVESLKIPHIHFKYNMTTNAILLDKYMDFLVEKDFKLLFSVDGNEFNSSYRVYKNGKPSFKKVVGNITKLRDTYPDFFETNVNFNSVLHDRSSVEEIYRFIKDKFGKVPRVAELNTNGIKPERQEEFYRMFHSKVESFNELVADEEANAEFKLESVDAVIYHSILLNYTGNKYAEYVDLFESSKSNKYIPTGTCQPFERKIFLTVNGKILPCERIGQEHVVAKLEDGKINLEEVEKYYSEQYQKVLHSCRHCYLKRTCGQCLFLLKEKDGKLICPGVCSEAYLKKKLSDFLSYAESHPADYEMLLSNIAID